MTEDKPVTLDRTELDKIYKALENTAVFMGVQGAEARAKKEDGKTSALMVAAVNEFGSQTPRPDTGQLVIPERSYIRSTVRKKRKKYLNLVSKLIRRSIKTTEKLKLDLIGVRAVADIKNTIKAGIAPANAESTIARKGSSKPLVDTGQLINSITHEIEKG